MQNEDFKYIIQDANCVYFGRELTYDEILQMEDAPFKFKVIVTEHFSRDTDFGRTIPEHLMELDESSLTYSILDRLKLSVKVCYKKKRKGLFGKEKEHWVHEACPLKKFCAEYRGRVKAQEMIIEDVSISKLALMAINI